MAASSRFAIAVHSLSVLAYLHKRGVDLISSQQIAMSVNTNPVVIRSLMKGLKKVGIIESKEGKAGGIRLSRSAAKISLDEIFAAVEDKTILNLNPNPEFKPCPVSKSMKSVLSSIFMDVDQAVVKTLKRHTLQDIVDEIR